MERLKSTPSRELMARIIGDVEVMGVGVREFTIETWDTILLSLSLMVTILVFDPDLTILALLPVPAAMLLAKAAGRWVTGRTTASREANGSLTTALQEQLSGSGCSASSDAPVCLSERSMNFPEHMPMPTCPW